MDQTTEQNNLQEFIDYFGYTPEEGDRRQRQAETFRPDKGCIYRRLQAEGKEQRDAIDPHGEM